MTQIDRLADAPLGQKVVAEAHVSVQPAAAAAGFTGGTLQFLDESGRPIGGPVDVPGTGDPKSAHFTPGASASHAVKAVFTRATWPTSPPTRRRRILRSAGRWSSSR